jgi:hypothetical protein
MRVRCMITLQTAAEPLCATASDPYFSPGYGFGSPRNDLGQPGRRPSSVTEVPGRQWDTLKPLYCGCMKTIIRPPAMPSLTAPVPHAGPAGVSPEPSRSTSDRRSEVLRGGCGEATGGLWGTIRRDGPGRVAQGEGPEAGHWGEPTWAGAINRESGKRQRSQADA